ncbi:hypothetical protein [Lysinibacillus pakistanensis]|uniref:hypothetical protein n=1 Tax=Lysinibacillus pakistanensis TaxID=759811 RepID=UPI003D2E83B7
MYKMYDTKLVNLQLIYGVAGAREKFEELCKSLIKNKFKEREVKGVRPNPGDGGIDIIVGKWTDENVDIYQCKYFINGIGESQKNNIRDSFKRVLKTVEENGSKINKWHLCVPIELTNEERNWFDNWKEENEKEDLQIELIDAHDISMDLMKPEHFHIYCEYFKQVVTKPIVVPTIISLFSDFSGTVTFSNLGEESAFNIQVILSRKKGHELLAYSDINYLGHLGKNDKIENLSIGELARNKNLLAPNVISDVKDNINETLEIDIRYMNSSGVMLATRTILKINEIFTDRVIHQIETYIQ